MDCELRPLNALVWREDLYPRINPDPQTIQRYAADLDVLPPVEVNQHNEIIDGYHRWTAHKKANAQEIRVVVTTTASDIDLLRLATLRNAAHGLQLSQQDKKDMAVRFYSGGTGMTKEDIAKTLSVSVRMVNSYLGDIDRALNEKRDRTIREMWMACYTQDEIAEAVGVAKATVNDKLAVCSDLEALPKSNKLLALHEDADFKPPLYDIWNFSKNSNSTKHFGNTAVEIVDNLLYLYTQPFDIVVDPFGGGGSTIDVCKQRSRRYWVSDRKPIDERRDIRQHDIKDGVAGPYHWSDVALVYLDPPYWKQAAGKYSDDADDLANMPLEQFTATMCRLINGYAAKLKPGAHIAMIISPTQWPNADKSVNYHDIDIMAAVGKKLRLKQHFICSYSTEQYNGTQVEIAKRDKLCLVLSRRLVVWEVV